MGPIDTSGQDSLGRAIRAAGIDVDPVWFDEVSSTNDEARRLAAEGAPEWTVVAAAHQTAGRGRLGRRWLDVPGRSLLCSVILRPRLGSDEIHLLTLAVAVELLEATGLAELGAKWPNDIVAGERKCAGILAEAEVRDGAFDHVILGVGVNLTTLPEDLSDDLRDTTTSLAIEGASTDGHGLLTAFLRGLRARLDGDGFPRGVVEAYRARCRTLGRRVRATTTSGDGIEGRAVGVDDLGSLLVERDDGRVAAVAFGELEHLT